MLIIARMIVAPVKGDFYRFDYGAWLYPEGVVGENLIYFNHEDIFKIVQEGYTNDENELMLENIAAVIDETDIPKGNGDVMLDLGMMEEFWWQNRNY